MLRKCERGGDELRPRPKIISAGMVGIHDAKRFPPPDHHDPQRQSTHTMPPALPSSTPALRRLGSSNASLPKIQCRHATLLRRPKRPYTFTQLITLSDGSTYLHRTTSPAAVYRSTKDIRNHPLWNPSSQKLMNVEEDEAGRLRAFRTKFGRGWDTEVVEDQEEVGALLSCCRVALSGRGNTSPVGRGIRKY